MLLADPYARKKSRTPSKNRVWNFFATSAHFTGDLSSKTQCSQWEKSESATTTASEHSYFALYEAYGTRPYEWGDDPDRFKANTKQEEKSLGLLNEKRRYRDLETGTFLTRDPIGYDDGANIYCYVHCNPITQFDAVGLKTGSLNPFSANFVVYNAVVNTGRHLTETGRQVARGNPVTATRVAVGTATSALSGDLFDSRNTVHAQSTGVSQNGILTNDRGAEKIAGHATEVTGQQAHTVQNGTHFGGLGDLVQCVSDALGAINTPSLNSAEAQREIAKNNGSGTLENTAHSQGTSVARGAADLVKGEGINERTSYQGFGGQITPKDGVYKDTYNERGPSVTDAIVTHADPRGWMHQGNYTTSTAADHGWDNYGKPALERAEQTEAPPTVEEIFEQLQGSP